MPLLVVSEYTKAGYVSGACDAGDCGSDGFPYQHDFGSVLAFVESNFGMQFIDQEGDKGYADRNALDGANGNIPLSDFFDTNDQRGFTNITPFYSLSTFGDFYYGGSYTPEEPDGNGSD